MENFIHELEIQNFKSIKHLQTDCKRVNVFIGKPNVGKSNILEALSLLASGYSSDYKRFLTDLIRYKRISDLFFDNNLKSTIDVTTDKISARIKPINNHIECYIGNERNFDSIEKYNAFPPDLNDDFIFPSVYKFNVSGELLADPSGVDKQSFVKPYKYNSVSTYIDDLISYLKPPFGINLPQVIRNLKELKLEIVEIFAQYGLEFVLKTANNELVLQKNEDGLVVEYPYSNMADTFQRLFFYYAAIDSNKDSVLILEEPEVHSFPPYTRDLSQRIVDSKENQFFITTHSPYLLENFMSSLDSDELNVFITYFENYETKIRKLTEEELKEALDFGIDLFYNLNRYSSNA